MKKVLTFFFFLNLFIVLVTCRHSMLLGPIGPDYQNPNQEPYIKFSYYYQDSPKGGRCQSHTKGGYLKHTLAVMNGRLAQPGGQ